MNIFNLITGANKQTNKRENKRNSLKSLLYSSLVLIALLSVVSCACENPIGPDGVPTPTTNTPNFSLSETNYVLTERPLHIVSIPENSLTRTISFDANILDLYLSRGYNPNDFSITHLDGVDVDVLDTDSLTIDVSAKTISGLIKLNQRLDFENPSDRGENSGDNDYEVAIFRVMSETSSNDFKLIVRITDAVDPKKLEILIDSYHLDDINQQRGIRELYLYEDSRVIAPLMGSDSNNFLTANLVADTSFLGDVDASTDLTKLYDQNDRIDAFLTATTVNSNSKTYHRLVIDFTEELYIQKVAIRGRQVGGYYGFVFILRDKNDHIISVHQASNPLSRGSGSDGNATSTYDFIPSYYYSSPITNFGITLDNIHFDISENTTNIILVDNFVVSPGYEYERGFVSIDPGADIDKFNVGDLYFLDNELVGLSFKTAPDAEDEQDADGDNTYDLGTVTITNVDGGRLTFALPVRVVNIPATISLHSNSVSYELSIYTSNIIDLTEIVNPSNFDNALNLERGTYNYQLTGTDASYFRIVGNLLKTVNNFGFKNTYENNGEYNVQVNYLPEGGGTEATLDVNIQIADPLWREITSSAPWAARHNFQSVVLTNGDILVMGGWVFSHTRPAGGGVQYISTSTNDVWHSGDRGYSWNNVNASAPWTTRRSFQAVVLTNNDILVMGGASGVNNGYGDQILNDIWLSSDQGRNWRLISIDAQWGARSDFQAVVLNNNDILVMGGKGTDYESESSAVYLSKDSGSSWSLISSNHWSPRRAFQSVVLTNNDILVMGGSSGHFTRFRDVWRSRDGGTNWNQESPPTWDHRCYFQSVVSLNNDVFVMGGNLSGGYTSGNVWMKKWDVDTAWSRTKIWPPFSREGQWLPRESFQSIILPNNSVLIMGGHRSWSSYSDIWTLESDNSLIE